MSPAGRYGPAPLRCASRARHPPAVLPSGGVLPPGAGGRDFVVVTPTASGKTLCYNLPVVSAILKNNDARALYLFPTKALSADQVSGLYDMIEALGVDIKTYTYDAIPRPPRARPSGRRATSWSPTRTCCTPTFSPTIPDGSSCLKISNTSSSTNCTPTAACSEASGQRAPPLMRLCAFYGSHPRFILCSATIANPVELASQLTGREIAAVTENGAPMGERHFVFYNPPVVNRQLGIRRGVVNEVRRIAEAFAKRYSQHRVLQSRIQVEVITRHLKECARTAYGFPRPCARLPRRLSALRAARNRARPASGRGGYGCVHQCAGAGHRHRLPHGVCAVRLSRHHRQHLAAGGPRRTAQGHGADHSGGLLRSAGPVCDPEPRLFLPRLAGARAGAAQ